MLLTEIAIAARDIITVKYCIPFPPLNFNFLLVETERPTERIDLKPRLSISFAVFFVFRDVTMHVLTSFKFTNAAHSWTVGDNWITTPFFS